MAYDRKDHYYRKAKREGKVSRAAYKISELQGRYRLIKKGDVVADLGCAPGGWLKEVSGMVGDRGRVAGIDLLPLKTSLPKNASFILGDLNDVDKRAELISLLGGKADAVLSDMSPNLSGVAFADAYKSYEIAMLALDVCRDILKDGGNFLVKIFPGDEFKDFLTTLKGEFREVITVVPKSTRKTSSERYVIAMGFSRR
jgi:23S rRNA (uridine2552-2'-O)-methyltransferase